MFRSLKSWGSLAIVKRIDRRSRTRSLRLESLDRREVFTGEIAAVEPPPADGSLAAYLQQIPEAGPIAPAEAVPATVDVQAVDAALVDAALNPAAEGENTVPTIHGFRVTRNAGYVFVTGTIADDDLMFMPYVILNGTQFMATTVYAYSSGYFSLVVEDMGLDGPVYARAYDFYGNVSPEVSAYLS
jgi:hypothetical protein